LRAAPPFKGISAFLISTFCFCLGRFLSYLACDSVSMKLNLLSWRKRDEGETMATFGQARLVKQLTGRIELIGGTADDRTAAREWCSLFLHEAIFST
jgi:hypothetical protein